MLDKLINKHEAKQWYKSLHEAEYILNNTIDKIISKTPSKLLFEYLNARINDKKRDFLRSLWKNGSFSRIYNKSNFDKK